VEVVVWEEVMDPPPPMTPPRPRGPKLGEPETEAGEVEGPGVTVEVEDTVREGVEVTEGVCATGESVPVVEKV